MDGLLSFLDSAELDVAEAKELVVRLDGDLAAEDLAELTEFGVEVFMIPLEWLEAPHVDTGRLDIAAARLPADRVQVVRQSAAHQRSFDAREAEL